MKTIDDCTKILSLWESKNYNKTQISNIASISRPTVISCIKKYKTVNGFLSTLVEGKIPLPKQRKNINHINNIICGNDEHLSKNYSYLLGVFLGDGHLSKYKSGIYSLIISCDPKYINIMDRIQQSIIAIMPLNRCNKAQRYHNNKLSWIDIYSYSKEWKLLFPFVQAGKKSDYKITLLPWQLSIIDKYPKDFLAGLIHTDGTRYQTTDKYKYVRYVFYQKSKDITDLFIKYCKLIDLKPTIHLHYIKTNEFITKSSHIYMVGLVKKTDTQFLDTFIGPKT